MAIWAIDNTMNPNGSPAHRLQSGFRWQHRHWTSAGLFVVAQAIDINLVPSCGRTMNPSMALIDILEDRHQRGPIQPMDICMDFGGNMGHGHQHSPWMQQDQGPRHGPQWPKIYFKKWQTPSSSVTTVSIMYQLYLLFLITLIIQFHVLYIPFLCCFCACCPPNFLVWL